MGIGAAAAAVVGLDIAGQISTPIGSLVRDGAHVFGIDLPGAPDDNGGSEPSPSEAGAGADGAESGDLPVTQTKHGASAATTDAHDSASGHGTAPSDGSVSGSPAHPTSGDGGSGEAAGGKPDGQGPPNPKDVPGQKDEGPKDPPPKGGPRPNSDGQ